MAEPMGSMGVMASEHGITLAEHYATGEDQGMRRELVDGTLIVSPFASWRHALAVQRLNEILVAACPPELLVLGSINVDREPATNVQPDLTVNWVADFDKPATENRPALAVEVLSPSTRRFDLTIKRQLYAEFGIPSYWIVDVTEPSVTILELRDDRYDEAQRLVGATPGVVARPFAVTFSAADLTKLR